MNDRIESVRRADVVSRAVVLFLQWIGCYVLVILGLGAGAIGLPVALAGAFLAVYALFRQMDGLIDEKLAA